MEVKRIPASEQGPGGILLRGPLKVAISFGWEEWTEFIAAVKRGEYDEPDYAPRPDVGRVSPSTKEAIQRIVDEVWNGTTYRVMTEGED